MKKLLLIFVFIIPHFFAVGQEICDNAIDDDECECSGEVYDFIENLLPNPDFEEMDCCPSGTTNKLHL